MIDLYTASACISRATAAVQQQKENADLEVQLAKIYITEALARVNESIRQIEGSVFKTEVFKLNLKIF